MNASTDGWQTQRLPALAAIYGNCSRSAADQTAIAGIQVIRDWIFRFNAKVPGGLRGRRFGGKTTVRRKLQTLGFRRLAFGAATTA